MSAETVKTSWERFLDQVKGLWSDHPDEGSEPPVVMPPKPGKDSAPAQAPAETSR
jgi:hypothetical protein